MESMLRPSERLRTTHAKTPEGSRVNAGAVLGIALGLLGAQLVLNRTLCWLDDVCSVAIECKDWFWGCAGWPDWTILELEFLATFLERGHR